MKKVFLFLTLLVTILSSCKDEGQSIAETIVEAINQKDTLKLNNALLPRQVKWDDVTFAEVGKDKVKIEQLKDNQYKAFVNDSTFFIFTTTENDGYKINTVKNFFILSDDMLQKAKRADYLTDDYDDVDAIIAIGKIRAELYAQEAKLAFDEKVSERIQSLYEKYVFGVNDFSSDANNYCTQKMLKKLAAAYGYEDGGYAVWELRSGAQDGDGGSQVNDVIALGDGWYEVGFLDMGEHCKKKIKAVKQGGKILFDDYK